MTGCPLSELPLERVEAELQELAAHIDAGLCRWLELLGEYEARAGHETWECRSVAQWVSLRCGVAPTTAWEHVRVARSLRELPKVKAAFGTGELSYSKVRALTRIATPESEGELIGLALGSTAAQLDTIIRASRRAIKQTEQEEAKKAGKEVEPETYLRHRLDDDGCLVGEFRMLPEDGATFLAAIAEYQEMRWRERRGGCSDSPAGDSATATAGPATDDFERGVRSDSPAGDCDSDDADREPYADTSGADGGEWRDDGDGFCARPIEWPTKGKMACQALVAMAETMLATGPTPLVGGDRFQVIANVDADVLFGVDAAGSATSHTADPEGVAAASGGADLRSGSTVRCEIDGGPGIGEDVARMLACDCSFVAMSMRGAVPESVGAKVRTITPAMRRKLRTRDRGCRWPGCTQRRFVDAHHIVFWGDGGPTVLANLLLLCRHHHRGVHVRGCSIEVVGDGRFVFRLADGSVVSESPAPPSPVDGTAPLIEANIHAGAAITPDTAVSGWDGVSLRSALPDAVTGVLCAVKGPRWVNGDQQA